MATLEMPTNQEFSAHRFGKFNNTQVFESPLTKSVQTLNLTGARWGVELTLPPMKRAIAAPWLAFLCELDGRAGRFNGFDPGAKLPLGVATGSPLVNGASQTGTSIITNGWTINTTGILKAGDFIGFTNGEMKMIVADANSDGSGNATLSINPAIRDAPGDTSVITTSNVKVAMMLVSDEVGWDINRLALYGVTFGGVEAWE